MTSERDHGSNDKVDLPSPRTDAALDARYSAKRAFPDPVVVECMKLEHDLAAAERRYSELELTSSAAISALVANIEKAERPTARSAVVASAPHAPHQLPGVLRHQADEMPDTQWKAKGLLKMAADVIDQLSATRSASEPMMPVAEVRKLLCERCRAGYALCGVKYEQHIVPSYSGDTYLDCRATEKLKAIMGVPDSRSHK